MNYEIIVGNVGKVYTSSDEKSARDTYFEYVEMSESGHGRSGGEPVTLLRGNEIIQKFNGISWKNPEVIARLLKELVEKLRTILELPDDDPLYDEAGNRTSGEVIAYEVNLIPYAVGLWKHLGPRIDNVFIDLLHFGEWKDEEYCRPVLNYQTILQFDREDVAAAPVILACENWLLAHQNWGALDDAETMLRKALRGDSENGTGKPGMSAG